MDQSIDRKDVVHKPSHLLIKTRDQLLLKDFKTVKSRAQQRATSATKQWGKAPPLLAPVNGVSANGKEDTSKVSKGPANGINGVSPSLKKPNGANQTVSAKEDKDEGSKEGSDDESDSGSVKGDSDGDSDSEDGNDEDDDKKSEAGDKATLQCLNCHERVTAPCWYCVDCISKLLQCLRCGYGSTLVW